MMENSFCACAITTSLNSPCRGGEHGRDLAIVVAAAAKIAGQTAARLGFRRFGILHQQRLARHDLPRGTKAALRTVVFDESFLHRIELVALRQTLDGEILFPPSIPRVGCTNTCCGR